MIADPPHLGEEPARQIPHQPEVRHREQAAAALDGPLLDGAAVHER